MRKLRVAVIGGGHLGQIHTRLLQQNSRATLVAVCDPQPLVQQKYIQQYDLRAVSDYRKIMGEIDAAIIATPTALHHRIAADLLHAGIHLLIEKPVTATVREAHELQNLAAAAHCTVQVGHVERFNPALRQALTQIGLPRYFEAQRLSGFTFRSTDISVVQDLMIHDVDLVQWMVGGRPSTIQAIGLSVFGQREDMAQARLQFDCGAVANLTASRCSYESRRRLNIFGCQGFAALDLTAGKVEIIRFPRWITRREFDFLAASPEQQAWVREKLFSEVLPRQEMPVESVNAIAEEQQDWLAAIVAKRPPAVPLDAALAAVETAERITAEIARHDWMAAQGGPPGPLFQPPASETDSAGPPAALQRVGGAKKAAA